MRFYSSFFWTHLAVIPELECVVQRGREDVLSVGRELDERYRRVIIIDQCFQTLTWQYKSMKLPSYTEGKEDEPT